MRDIGVAAAQAISERGDVAGNVEQHCQLAQLAARQGADVVVFPELSLTGYELDLAPELAFTAEDARLEPLIDVASRHQVALIVGAPVGLASGLHIGAFVFGRDRSTRIYTKRHLYGAENDVFVPGSLDPMLEVGDDRGAIAICADTSAPEHAEAAARQGASLYLAGAFFDPEGYPENVERLAGYATQHEMTVVLANSGGPATSFASAGGSGVWSPAGALVASLPGPGLGVVIARRSEHEWTGEAIGL
jgi:predicted amidohydrolase